MEVAAFKQVFQSSPDEASHVARIFNLAKQDVAGYETYADQIAALLKDDKKLRQDVLEGLMHVATADGGMHPKEDKFLRDVAHALRLHRERVPLLPRPLRGGQRQPLRCPAAEPRRQPTTRSRAQYRKLVSDNHPDKLMGRGVPPEFVDIATRKLAAINAAYDAIAKERGL